MTIDASALFSMKKKNREKIMSTENIKEIINQYFDNELTKSEEVILFTQLSQDENAREYFKKNEFTQNCN
ncbi:MAG: hypothetical protein H6613_06520 [Ignavibacteriales bacterium]|nr:hypothetical protein [Ignavibacteriales bacterium]